MAYSKPKLKRSDNKVLCAALMINVLSFNYCLYNVIPCLFFNIICSWILYALNIAEMSLTCMHLGAVHLRDISQFY